MERCVYPITASLVATDSGTIRALHTCSFHKKALLYSIRPVFLPPPEPQPSSRMHIAIVLYLVLYLLVSVSISAAYTMDSFPLTPSPSTSQTQSSNSGTSFFLSKKGVSNCYSVF